MGQRGRPRKKPVETSLEVPLINEEEVALVQRLERPKMRRRRLDKYTLEELETEIKNYFAYQTLKMKPYTLVGIANYLGLNANTVRSYAEKNRYFKRIYEMAKQTCEEQLLENMLMGRSNVIGSIFVLKNLFGYVDKTEQLRSDEVFLNAESIEEIRRKKEAKMLVDKETKTIEAIKETSEIVVIPEIRSEENVVDESHVAPGEENKDV